jgi:hypothetical protein
MSKDIVRNVKLSKRIPSRVETIRFIWLQKNFHKATKRYKELRKKYTGKEDICYWCKKHFEDDEMISLGSIIGKGNRTFCQKCISEVTNAD